MPLSRRGRDSGASPDVAARRAPRCARGQEMGSWTRCRPKNAAGLWQKSAARTRCRNGSCGSSYQRSGTATACMLSPCRAPPTSPSWAQRRRYSYTDVSGTSTNAVDSVCPRAGLSTGTRNFSATAREMSPTSGLSGGSAGGRSSSGNASCATETAPGSGCKAFCDKVLHATRVTSGSVTRQNAPGGSRYGGPVQTDHRTNRLATALQAGPPNGVRRPASIGPRGGGGPLKGATPAVLAGLRVTRPAATSARTPREVEAVPIAPPLRPLCRVDGPAPTAEKPPARANERYGMQRGVGHGHAGPVASQDLSTRTASGVHAGYPFKPSSVRRPQPRGAHLRVTHSGTRTHRRGIMPPCPKGVTLECLAA